MAEKKKSIFSNRELEYAKDYVVSLEGESVYVGPLFTFRGDQAKNTALFRRVAVFSAVVTALMVFCGFIRVSAMTFSPVCSLSYGGGLIICFVMLVSCIRLAFAKQPMRRRTFDYSFKRIRWLPVVSAVFGAVACIAAAVYELTDRTGGFTAFDGAFIAAQAVVTALAVIIFLSTRGVTYDMAKAEKPE